MTKKLKSLTTPDLITYFKEISAKAQITPFTNIELKKYDTKNVKQLKAFKFAINEYVRCIQELRARDFTLQEIMGEILK